MTGISSARAFHEEVKLVAGLAPVAGSGSAQNGAWIDRKTFLSALCCLAYSTSGGVTGGTITCKFQDATDGSGTGAADYGATTTVTLTGTNPSGVAEVAADLKAARSHIRVVVDSDPTGGTPASIVAAAVLLGGAARMPV